MDAPTVAERQLAVCEFMGWPALRLQQGPLRLHLVPQIGGRLMGISHGANELCFVNPALAGRLPFVAGTDWRELCGSWDFPLWGGGKTWVAPEAQWPDGAPHADLDSGAYTLTRSWFDTESMGVELVSPVCRVSSLQITRRIELFAGDAAWQVTQTLCNRGTRPRQCGVWDVLMLRRPATLLVPLPATPGEPRDAAHGAAHPAVHPAVHPFTGKGPLPDLYAAGVIAVANGALHVVCAEAVEFKVGALSEHGEVQVRLPTADGALVYRRCSDIAPGEAYAHGHPLEVFNAPRLAYFEVESHSRYATLAPGESVTLKVSEQLTPAD